MTFGKGDRVVIRGTVFEAHSETAIVATDAGGILGLIAVPLAALVADPDPEDRAGDDRQPA